MSRVASGRSDNTMLGVGLIVGAVLLMTLGDALVKLASASLSLWQLFVMRGLFALPILIGIMRWRGIAMWPIAPGWAYLRALLLVLSWIVYYAALPVLSLSVAAAALYTAPLFIGLLSAQLIGEPVGVRRWIAIAIGFVGVIAILRPGAESFSWLTLLPVLGAVSYACAMVLTRSRCRGETPLALALALNVSLMLSGVVATATLGMLRLTPEQTSIYPFIVGSWTAMRPFDWGMVALLGVLISVFSVCVARAYQVASPSIVATFDYAYLVFAAGWGFVLFGDAPDAATVLGMLLITVAGILVTAPAGGRSGGVSEPTTGAAS